MVFVGFDAVYVVGLFREGSEDKERQYVNFGLEG